MKPTKIIIQFLAVFAVASGAANAATTALIDWANGSPPTAPDSNGNYWNSLGSGTAGFTATALTSSTNTATGWSVAVSMPVSGPLGIGFSGAGVNGPVGLTAPFNTIGANRPTIDGLFVNRNDQGTPKITITGLAINSLYEFSAIGGRASGGNDGFIKVITGAFGSGGSVNTILGLDPLANTFSLLNSGTILDFEVTSNSSGVVAFRFFENEPTTSLDVANSATFNALSITVIPEPSAALLGSLGLLALLRRRRA